MGERLPDFERFVPKNVLDADAAAEAAAVAAGAGPSIASRERPATEVEAVEPTAPAGEAVAEMLPEVGPEAERADEPSTPVVDESAKLRDEIALWEQRHRSHQGMLRSEQQRNTALETRLVELERKLSEGEQVAEAAKSPAQRYGLTEKEAEFLEDPNFLSAVRKVAAAETRPIVDERMRPTEAQLMERRRAEFAAELQKAIPDAAVLNADPEFVRWLNTPHAAYDDATPRQIALGAAQRLNPAAYASVADRWRFERGMHVVPAPPNGKGDAAPAAKPQPAKPSINALVHPDARPAGANLEKPKKISEEEYEKKVDVVLRHPTMSPKQRQQALQILDDQWVRGDVELAKR